MKLLIDYLDIEEKVININNTLVKEEGDLYSFSYNSENNNEEALSFDNINYYEELNYKFDIDIIDNEINVDKEDNLSISNSIILKENINEEGNSFNIDNIEKERGFLTLFSSTNNNISQTLKNLLSFNEIKKSLFNIDGNIKKYNSKKYPKKWIIDKNLYLITNSKNYYFYGKC